MNEMTAKCVKRILLWIIYEPLLIWGIIWGRGIDKQTEKKISQGPKKASTIYNIQKCLIFV